LSIFALLKYLLIKNREMKFTSILRNVILEQSKFKILLDKFTEPSVNKEGKKVRPKITKEHFYELVKADPTTKLNDVDMASTDDEQLQKIKAGKYVLWLLKWYLNPNMETKPEDPGYEKELKHHQEMFIEDLSQLTNDLAKHNRFKDRIQGERDIMRMSPDQLYDAVKDFSLEKKKASAKEKEEAAQTFKHPGSEILAKGKNFTLVKITDSGELGRNAACFYGGNQLDTDQGESRWCTSSPGYDRWFNKYIKEGPLYVFIKNEDTKHGSVSKLPATRYQFHFPSDQFQDTSNRRIDVVSFLNGPASDLKDFFKSEFAKGLLVNGDALIIDSLDNGVVGKYIALYGLDDLIEQLPESLNEISIKNRDKNNVNIVIPETISRFKNLEMILFSNCIDSVPNSICQLEKLKFISFLECPNLKTIPDCIADLRHMFLLNLQGSDNVTIPESIKSRAEFLGDGMWDFE
jgi:hypothetical protein